MKKRKTHTDGELSAMMMDVAESFRRLKLHTAAALCRETARRLKRKKPLAKPKR